MPDDSDTEEGEKEGEEGKEKEEGEETEESASLHPAPAIEVSLQVTKWRY